MERSWAMPNKWTFLIKPIKKLLDTEMAYNELWIDPYAGKHSPAKIRNDINPDNPAEYHLDALDFVKRFDNNSIDGILLDPPYSSHQISQCYKSLGLRVSQHTIQSSFYANVHREVPRILKPNGKVITFGWHSNGVGNSKLFKLKRILLVAHGGHHNDTIVTVEQKINQSLF